MVVNLAINALTSTTAKCLLATAAAGAAITFSKTEERVREIATYTFGGLGYILSLLAGGFFSKMKWPAKVWKNTFEPVVNVITDAGLGLFQGIQEAYSTEYKVRSFTS